MWLPLRVDRPAPDRPYDDFAEAEALLDAIGRLPDVLRAAFLMHHVEEIPLAEIALTLDVPEGTVKSRLHAARAPPSPDAPRGGELCPRSLLTDLRSTSTAS